MATKVQALKDVNGNKLYPKTSADAVAYDTTSSVKSKLANGVYCERVKNVSGDNFPINATTLNGYTSDNFVKVSDLETLQDGSAMTIEDGQGNDVTLQQYIDDTIRAHNVSNDSHANLFNSKTFYVDANKGDDDYSGTSSQPFKTIQAAIDNTPQLTTSVVILVKNGVYQENVHVINKHFQNIIIKSLSGTNDVDVNSIRIYNCKQVNLYNLNICNCYKNVSDYINSIEIQYSSCEISGCNITNNSTDQNVDNRSGVYGVFGASSHVVLWNCCIKNYQYAIRCDYDTIHLAGCTGDNNVYAYVNNDGIIICDDNTKIKYTQSKIYNENNSGLTVNQSAIKYLNMFSNADSTNAASFHNSIYRGKDITNYLNDGSLFTRISNGTFDDLFIGDYFYLNDLAVDGYTVITKKMVLCGFDTYLGTGDKELTRHHAVVMPSGRLFTAAMNDTDTTEGGYYNSKMHTEIMPKIAAGIKTIIGDSHLITYRDLLTNTVSDGKSSNWEWCDVNCRICSEIDVYGSIVWGSGYDIGLSNRQLPIFKLYTRFYQGEDRYWMWLSTIVSTTNFAHCGTDGSSYTLGNMSNSDGGVRPRFLIG